MIACGREKSEIELLVEKNAAARTAEEFQESYHALKNAGEYALPELRRIAEDKSYPEKIRIVAIRALASRPPAVPTLFQCLEDSSDTIRTAATEALDGCVPYGIYLSPKDSEVLDAYRTWWSKHQVDYIQELARLYKSGYRDFVRPSSAIAETNVRRLFFELAEGKMISSRAPAFRRIVSLGPAAIPDLKVLAADTADHRRTIAYMVLGAMKETEAVIALLEALDREEDLNIIAMITLGLDQRLHLGRVTPLEPEKSGAIVEKYREWRKANRTGRIPG